MKLTPYLRRQLSHGLAILSGSLVFLGAADASVIVFQDDFESLTLGPSTSDTETPSGTGLDFASAAPGWTKDNTSTPTGGPVEFEGWSFLNKDFWISTAGDQSRSTFSRGTGTVAVADGDEYDDGAVSIEPDLFNVFMETSVSLLGVDPGLATIQVRFDSSFRPYDGQTGLVDVSFDGGTTFSNLLTLDTATLGGNSVLDRADEAVTLDTARASDDMILRFGMTGAGNDWWWAVDNVSVAAVPEPSSAMLLFTGISLFSLRRRRKS